jgi:hypothetical protein
MHQPCHPSCPTAHKLIIPRRPPWDETTTPDQLDAQEKASFLSWRRCVAGASWPCRRVELADCAQILVQFSAVCLQFPCSKQGLSLLQRWAAAACSMGWLSAVSVVWTCAQAVFWCSWPNGHWWESLVCCCKLTAAACLHYVATARIS